MGHPPQVAWSYTPRQMAAWLFLGRKRQTRKEADDLTLGFMAARGDPREVKKAVKRARDE